MTKGDIYAMVGYEARLWKMKRSDLIAEASRVGIKGLYVRCDVPNETIVRWILEVQGINDDILVNAPPKRRKMAEEIEGTVRDLYRLRQARRSTIGTIQTLQTAGMDTTTLKVTYDHLVDTVVLIPVPCLVCRRNYRLPASVADDSLPFALVCAECDGKINVELQLAESKDRVRRRRRTKAEIEADRLAAEQGEEEAEPPPA